MKDVLGMAPIIGKLLCFLVFVSVLLALWSVIAFVCACRQQADRERRLVSPTLTSRAVRFLAFNLPSHEDVVFVSKDPVS